MFDTHHWLIVCSMPPIVVSFLLLLLYVTADACSGTQTALTIVPLLLMAYVTVAFGIILRHVRRQRKEQKEVLVGIMQSAELGDEDEEDDDDEEDFGHGIDGSGDGDRDALTPPPLTPTVTSSSSILVVTYGQSLMSKVAFGAAAVSWGILMMCFATQCHSEGRYVLIALALVCVWTSGLAAVTHLWLVLKEYQHGKRNSGSGDEESAWQYMEFSPISE